MSLASPWTASDLWSCLIPENNYDIDAKISWKASSETPKQVSHRWLKSLESGYSMEISDEERYFLEHQLRESVETFTSFCMKYLGIDEVTGKLDVASKPKHAPTHFQVHESPVLWTQSLFGPGYQWAQGDCLLWDQEQSYEGRRKEQLLIPGTGTKTYQVPEGDAVIMLGRCWGDLTRQEVEPLVYKEPEVPKTGRVMLTMEPLMKPFPTLPYYR